MSNISQLEIDSFHTMIMNLNVNKRKFLLERAGKIDKRLLLSDDTQNTKEESENNNQDSFEFNFQEQEEKRNFKKMSLQKGSIYTITSFQNTILSLIIDGFISEIQNNNKRFYSPLYTNGNAGVSVINVKFKQTPKELDVFFKDNEEKSNLLRDAIKKADQMRQEQQNQQNENQQKYEYFDGKFIVVPGNFYKEFQVPFKSQPGSSITNIMITKEQMSENEYPKVETNIYHSQNPYKLIFIDCEMVQTEPSKNNNEQQNQSKINKQNLSLARLSIVDEDNNVIFDEYCKPDAKIEDYLTSFSGITEKTLENQQTETQLKTKFQNLVSQLNKENNLIICGHGLENDFRALNFAYDQVIDTALLFQNGIFKQKLKFLVKKYLNEEIQQNIEGHSSIEDAQAVRDLVFGVLKDMECKDIKVGENVKRIKIWKQKSLETRIKQCRSQAFYQFNVKSYKQDEFFKDKEKLQNNDKRQLNLVDLDYIEDLQETINQVIDTVPNRSILIFIIGSDENQEVNIINYKIKQ